MINHKRLYSSIFLLLILLISYYQSFSQENQKPRIRINDYPVEGVQKSLVLLVEFPDISFSTMDNAYDYFYRLLNEENFTYENGANGSARDYFKACSNNIFDPNFVVVGPIMLPKESSYYGADINRVLDANIHELVVDAATIADELLDFSEFDNDLDGEVDNIYIFYAGYSQADTGISEAIWPNSNFLLDNRGISLTLDGKVINHYAMSNEIRGRSSNKEMPVGIGVFIHEFSHVLGLTDHYDSNFASNRPGVNNWDTMGSANYFNNMHTPPLFSAFERAELGWLEYIELKYDDNNREFMLLPLEDVNSAYRVIVPETNEKEYFILENRQQKGWDSFLPGHGLLVWHIDMDDEAWLNNQVNTDPTHNRVDIIEADGYESENNFEGDPFPGKRKVTEYTFKSWKNDDVFSLSEIEESEDGKILFVFCMNEAGYNNINQLSTYNENVKYFDINGKEVSKDYKGIVIELKSDGSVKKIINR